MAFKPSLNASGNPPKCSKRKYKKMRWLLPQVQCWDALSWQLLQSSQSGLATFLLRQGPGPCWRSAHSQPCCQVAHCLAPWPYLTLNDDFSQRWWTFSPLGSKI